MTPKRLRRRLMRWLTLLAMLWGAAQLVVWRMSSGHEGSNRFDRYTIFGGNQFTSVAPALESGRVQAIFGAAAIDVSGAELSEEGADLFLSCRLAGISVAVSPSWRVVLLEAGQETAWNGAGGAVQAEVTDPAQLADDAPTLRVTIERPLLGGIAISA